MLRKRILCVLLLAFLGLATATVSAQIAGQHRPSWMVTNEKASSAASGNPAAVAALVEDVLDGSVVLQNLSAVNSDLKSSLINAELDYRNGNHPGIPDMRVAVAINALAKTTGAPEFSYTDTAEVRRLRMKLMPIVPALFMRDLKREDKQGESHIRKVMSPVEAVYLLARLIDQKISNPDYQLTAQERRDKWAQLHSPAKPIAVEPNPRTKELLAAVGATTNTLSLRDLGALTSDIVLNLGLRQEGGK